MAEWNGEGLTALAPEVDVDMALAAFERRRASGNGSRRRRVLAAAIIAVVVLALAAGVAATRDTRGPGGRDGGPGGRLVVRLRRPRHRDHRCPPG